MTDRQYSRPGSDDSHRIVIVRRMVAAAVLCLYVTNGGAIAQTKTLWNFVGSGSSVYAQTGSRVVSILGGPFVGNGSAGGNALTSGFGARFQGGNTPTGTPDAMQGVPTVFSLSQNYPNPFNPSTVIEYGLPSTSLVQLTVFDVLGRNVASLYDGEQAAGFQRLTWNASCPTGVYFYRIVATSVEDPRSKLVQVKKMLLVR